MNLDEATLRNLELLNTIRDQKREGSLISAIDETVTPMGGRLIKNWMTHPLLHIDRINARLNTVEVLHNNTVARENLATLFKEILDIERIIGRIGLNAVNARDLVGLKNSLKKLPEIKAALNSLRATQLLSEIYDELEDCSEIVATIEGALNEEPPLSLRDGNLIKEGYLTELDELRGMSKEGKSYISKLQAAEIQRTGINSLKVGYNKVFGYYLEVSKANKHLVPEDYICKQTLVNNERYITPELKEYESKVIGAEDKSKALEHELFMEVRGEVAMHIGHLQKVAHGLAQLDALNGLAQAAVKHHYAKPEMTQDNVLLIKDGRHPVMEQLTFANECVPNDVHIDTDAGQQLLLITGPNMGGKSTFLRQAALITLLAHMGSFVPATSAKIGLCDRIFTRVGASDSLIHGQSTFMVEMQEAANILNNATERSLVILDEIGRGTSTYDGVSIAWAITEYLHNKVGAKTLFATHYHELIAVVDNLEKAKNYSVEVRESKEGIIFLYKILKGAVDKSYGIEVAKLAGLPREVTDQAQHILVDLEENIVEQGIQNELANPRKKQADGQLDIFNHDQRSHRALEALKDIDPNAMTPLEALQKLTELKAF